MASDPTPPPAGASLADVSPADVVVIGGSAAGLSGALALGRSRRRVVVIDSGRPRNAPSAHMNGVLGFDGVAPADFLAAARRDVLRYDVTIVDGTVVRARRRSDSTFAVTLDGGQEVKARRLLVATGLTDELPDISGLRERWGIDVIHCPYCHGWEVRDQPIGIIATGPMAVHSTLMFRQWTDDLTLIVHDGPEPTADEMLKFEARGIRVVRESIAEVIVSDDRISGVRLASGSELALRVLVSAPRLAPNAAVLESFGLVAQPHPMGSEIGSTISVDPTGRTDAAGVWAAGNVVDLMATVPASVAAGYMTGARINADLIEEETAADVAAFLEVPSSRVGA